MSGTELAIIGVALGILVFFAVLAIWLTEKTLKGEHEDDHPQHFS